MFQTIKIKDIKEQIGLLTRTLRKQHQLTQQELADLLDVSRLTIQNIEAGKNFTIDNLLKIVQHFDLLSDLNQQIENYHQAQLDAKSLY